MTVTTIDKDTEALTLTLIADFAAPVEAVWELWRDPRKLERWWGPPGYPATFVEHDLTPGALVTYFMTGPEGDRHHGWWRIETVDAPRELTLEDGFGDAEGRPLTDMTGRLRMRLFEHGGGTRMELLPKALRQSLREAGLVVEVMDTGAACRTYNVLLAEGRRVGAALLPV